MSTTTPDIPFKLLQASDIPELTDVVLDYLKSEVIQLMVLPNLEDIYIPLINETETEDTTDVVTEGAEPLKPAHSPKGKTTVNTKDLFAPHAPSPLPSPSTTPTVEPLASRSPGIAPIQSDPSPMDLMKDLMGLAVEATEKVMAATGNTPPLRAAAEPGEETRVDPLARRSSIKHQPHTIKVNASALFGTVKKKEG
eukprot:TRINITY_DN7051_c0_g1_i3.p1 TRINITY_DN7051_c0_g1~~TRINITY_DN7051_c0_g1_i3.p1  ORF type:complete len:196 (+),score=41.89 TRINITY_DN7051_c0_g1_i3:856-1443(+)